MRNSNRHMNPMHQLAASLQGRGYGMGISITKNKIISM